MSGPWPIPSTWTWVQTGEIAEVVGGGTPSTSDPGNFGGGIPWVTPADLSSHSGLYISGGARTLTSAGLEGSGARWLERGAVLFSSRAPIGYCAIAANRLTTNQGFKSFVPFAGMRPEFLLHWLRSAKSIAEELASGTTFLELSGAKAATIPVPLAPEGEQARICAQLDELLEGLDEAEHELNLAKRKLALYRQSLLRSAVEGALTTEWRSATLSLTGPVGLPAEWRWSTIGELATVVRGASPRPAGDPRYFGGTIPWITVGSLTADDQMYLTSVNQFVTEEGRDRSRWIDPGTLLLTNSGATLGVPKITKIGGCINDGSVALLGVDDSLKTYLYWFLRTQTAALRALNQGAAQPNLNTGIVRSIRVPVPPAEEMQVICSMAEQQIERAQSQAEVIDRALVLASAQRQNILRAAFSGQLVPQDTNDEPASVLLERIRAQRKAAADKPAARRPRKAKIAA